MNSDFILVVSRMIGHGETMNPVLDTYRARLLKVVHILAH
jgi:hypothetical protein